MAERVIVRLYLPMEMGAFVRIQKAIARDYPDAVLIQPSTEGEVAIQADPDIPIGERRRIARERTKRARAAT